jgi:alpha-beta hydrolase superfamily lysophospholipase
MIIRFLQRKRKAICGFLVLGLFLGLAASWIFGSVFSAPCNHPVPLPKDLAVEQVTFPSQSGATIHGWLVVPTTYRAVVILQHGVHADKSTLVERAQFLSQSGYAVLLFDFQSHGESIGKKITFGYLESRDSQAAVAFVKKRFPGKPIGVDGVSLGAAAEALADPPLDVQAMVFESMFPTIVDATKDRIEMRLGPIGRCLSPLLTAQIALRAGCSADDLRPIVNVAKITAPKLFLAGTADLDTKFTEAQEIYSNAATPKIFVPFKGARHEDLLKFEPEQYKKTVLEFFATNLK